MVKSKGLPRDFLLPDSARGVVKRLENAIGGPTVRQWELALLLAAIAAQRRAPLPESAGKTQGIVNLDSVMTAAPDVYAFQLVDGMPEDPAEFFTSGLPRLIAAGAAGWDKWFPGTMNAATIGRYVSSVK